MPRRPRPYAIFDGYSGYTPKKHPKSLMCIGFSVPMPGGYSANGYGYSGYSSRRERGLSSPGVCGLQAREQAPLRGSKPPRLHAFTGNTTAIRRHSKAPGRGPRRPGPHRGRSGPVRTVCRRYAQAAIRPLSFWHQTLTNTARKSPPARPHAAPPACLHRQHSSNQTAQPGTAWLQARGPGRPGPHRQRVSRWADQARPVSSAGGGRKRPPGPQGSTKRT